MMKWAFYNLCSVGNEYYFQLTLLIILIKSLVGLQMGLLTSVVTVKDMTDCIEREGDAQCNVRTMLLTFTSNSDCSDKCDD